MAKTETKKNWWQLFVCLMLALMLAFTMAACAKDGGDDDDDKTDDGADTVTDEQVIKNGDFEIVSKDDTYPVTSITNWTKSYASTTNVSGKTNPSSTFSSGIVNTRKLDDLNFTSLSDEQKEALKKLTLNTPFKTDAEIEEKGSNVLMLANKYSGDTGVGTVQKATSSTTLTLKAGTAIKVGVWVRTNGFFDKDHPENKSLKNHNNEDVDGKAGAYIGLVNSINSATVAPFQIKNINTNGEWVKYTFLINACDYTSSTVKLVLGLGYGDSTNIKEYVEGYAFFDNISYEVIPVTSDVETVERLAYTNAKYASVHEESIFEGEVVKSQYNRIDIDASKIDKLYNIGTVEEPDYAVKLNLALGMTESNLFDEGTTANVTLSKDTTTTAPHNSENDGLSKIYTKADLKANSAYASFMEKYPFSSTNNILLLRAKQPTALTATINNNGDDFELAANIYKMISIWVKTTEIISGNGATITVRDKIKNSTKESDFLKISYTSIDTTTIKSDPDFYDGWTKYTFFISNGSTVDAPRYFDIQLNFGLTTQSTSAHSYNSGWAAFTNFDMKDVSEEIYKSVSNGTYIKKETLNAGQNDHKSDTGIDKVAPSIDEDAIKTGAVTPSNYYGATGGTSLTGTKNANGEYDYTNIPYNGKAGLINSKYIANYITNGLFTKAGELGGNTFQPLMIKNTSATSYGYISKASKTLAAKTTTQIKVRTKVSGNAKAYIYLASSLTDNSYNVLSLERPENGGYAKQAVNLSRIVTEADSDNAGDTDGWVTVSFFITTGDTAVNYRIELWNGARDGTDNCQGTVLFDLLSVSTLTDDTYSKILEVFTNNNTEYDNKTTVIENNVVKLIKYKQQPKDDTDETKYEEMIIYAFHSGETNFNTFVNYSSTDVKVEEEKEDEDEEKEEEQTTKADGNVWLMISSLILAVALIVTLVLVVIKRFKLKIANRKVEATTRYLGKKKHFNKNGKNTSDEKDIDDLEDDDKEDELDATDDADDNEDVESPEDDKNK